jgi:CheY-like chemotaxis protein
VDGLSVLVPGHRRLRQPSFQGELLLITRGGDPRPVHLSLGTVDRGRRGVQRIGVFRDISPEHELRFRVIREQKFRTLGSLAAGGRLTIGVGGDGARAWVSVADTGRGMSPEVQRLAFEPFFTTRSAEGGTGLGLPLAQEIVHRYGGTITVQSRENVGTTFTLTFPAVTADTARAPVFLPVLEPLRVLAVEDEPEVLDLLRAMLTHAGHRVLGAASGREALGLFEREAVDVVVTDLGMPGLTGLALAREVKRRRPVPVVLLTGWAQQVEGEEAAAVDVLLAKPFSRERLLAALARAVPDRVRSS